jgi:hypothetical protein
MNEVGPVEVAVVQEASAAVPAPLPVRELRYLTELNALPTCPPPVCQEPVSMGYRFATANLADQNNALPVLKINPNRFLNEPKLCCSGLALSMYVTLPQLNDRARKGVKNNPNFLKRIGDHYVQLTIADLGRQCEPSSVGHFDFFEYTSFQFAQQVISHGRLET